MLSEQNYSSIMKIYFSIIQELQCQGDEFWLSRAKNKLLTLLNTAKTTYDLYRQMHALKVNEIHKQIYDIIEYINMSLNKKLNIQQICKKFCTNHTTLAKNFKSIMGITVNEYIRNQRIALVKQSLAYTDLTLDEIAYSHGFNSTSYLSEVFKKSTHFTPMQYRNHVRNSREGNRI